MDANQPTALTDRQARAVLVAAELLDFERKPDLYEAWYDLDLHDDAECAVRSLHPSAIPTPCRMPCWPVR